MPLGADPNHVAGHCPMGCGQTLLVGSGGHITCSFTECPDPARVDTILADGEHEHIAVIRREDFTIQHPLRERGEELLSCELYQWLRDLPGPPRKEGCYRVTAVTAEAGNPAWKFDALAGDA